MQPVIITKGCFVTFLITKIIEYTFEPTSLIGILTLNFFYNTIDLSIESLTFPCLTLAVCEFVMIFLGTWSIVLFDRRRANKIFFTNQLPNFGFFLVFHRGGGGDRWGCKWLAEPGHFTEPRTRAQTYVQDGVVCCLASFCLLVSS
jgi:hypothetical protein